MERVTQPPALGPWGQLGASVNGILLVGGREGGDISLHPVSSRYKPESGVQSQKLDRDIEKQNKTHWVPCF